MTRPLANLQAAVVLLQGLHRQGLERVVLCPGSRSGPLALAAGGLARAGLLKLTTALDERSAAFLAVGSATASGRATAVITTSGTAVANLLPAAVEADRSSQPLLLLTADRPIRLKHCGANQTVNQEQFLQPVCRWCASGPDVGLDAASPPQLLQLAKQAWHQAHHWPGPVHLNLPFEEPLHPSAEQQAAFWSNWSPVQESIDCLESPPAGSASMAVASLPGPPAPELELDPDRPGVVVAGPWRGLADQRPAFEAALYCWQQRSGWPVLVDPLAAVPATLAGQVRSWDLLLPDQLPLPAGVAVNELQLLRLGPMPASRRLEAWLQRCTGPHLLITEGEERSLDPLQCACQWSGGLARWPQIQLQANEACLPLPPVEPQPEADNAWSALWQQRDRSIAAWLEQRLPLRGGISEPALMFALSRLLPPGLPLMLAASSPVRDWQAFAVADRGLRPCFSFRGASGIDGTLSLGLGLAAVLGRSLLITGDLALLHDSNGWLQAGHASGSGPLLILLIDNAGGGIFQQLPVPAAPAEAFEQLFAMPQKTDPLALAAAHGIATRQIACLDDLASALEWGLSQSGPALLRVCTDRQGDAALRTELRREVLEITMAPALESS